MTHDARPRSALDAIINVGCNSAATEANGEEGYAADNEAQGALAFAASHAALVLSRILSLAPIVERPCIQFVACGGEVTASSVATAASKTATMILGRSLLLNARMEQCGFEHAVPFAYETIPDAFVHGLYHHHLAQRVLDLDLLFGRNRRSTFSALTKPFKFIAVDSRAPCTGPASTALAPMCSGTVLVVHAGASSQSAIKETALHITRAGGKVIGTVLNEAPSKPPRWIGRS